MKKEKITYIAGKLAFGGLITLCMASCGNELETVTGGEQGGDTETPAMPEGTLVVDYAVEEAANRAISDDPELPANQRISSLAYLLYKEGQLVKFRQISDINTQTEWPLKRSTMTWKQRQELKDTLELSGTYQVVFVANAPLLDAQGQEVANPLLDYYNGQGEEKTYKEYKDVYLKLPEGEFTDLSMYYVSTRTISAAQIEEAQQKPDRDHPYNCPITLQRIVTRTDIERVETYVTDDTDYKDIYIKGVVMKEGGLRDELMKEEGLVYQKMQTYFSDLAAAIENGGIDGLYIASINKMANALRGDIFKQVWNENKDAIQSLIEPVLVTDCAANTLLKAQCTDWTEYARGDVSYENSSFPNAFYLNNWEFSHLENEKSAQLSYGVNHGTLTVIGFGKNKGVGLSQTVMPHITTLTLSPSQVEGSDKELTLSGLNFKVEIGGNEQVQLLCNPLSDIKVAERDLTYQLVDNTLLPLKAINAGDYYVPGGEGFGGTRKEFLEQVDAAIKNASNGRFGTSWSEAKLEISIPVMSEPDNVTWTSELAPRK